MRFGASDEYDSGKSNVQTVAHSTKKLMSWAGSLFKASNPTAAIFAAIGIFCLIPVFLLSFLPMALWGKSTTDLTDMSAAIQDALADSYTQAIGVSSEQFTRNIEKKFNCSTINNYYKTYFEVDPDEVNEDGEYQKKEGTGIWLFEKSAYGQDGTTTDEGKNACYVLLRYTPSLESMEQSDDHTASLSNIIYSYALAANQTLAFYPPSGASGSLGKIKPVISDEYALNKANQGKKLNWSGFVNYETALFSWNSRTSMARADADEIKAFEQMYSRPGYSDQATGLSIQIQMNGVSTLVEGKNYGSGRCGVIQSFRRKSDITGNDADKNIVIEESACFDDENYKQIVELAADNGFIIRYPNGSEQYTGHVGEYWTFRYVGKEAAAWCYNDGNPRSLEEYLLNIGQIGDDDYGDFTVSDRKTLTGTDSYTPGSDGGKDVTSQMGTDLDLVNNKRYVSDTYTPSDLVLCDGAVALRQNACDAYKAWEKAVAEYNDGQSAEGREEEEEEKEQIEEADKEAQAPTQAVIETDGLNTNFTQYAKDLMHKGSTELTDSSNEKVLKYIKSAADTYFVTDANYPELWTIHHQYGPAEIEYGTKPECPAGYTPARDSYERDAQGNDIYCSSPSGERMSVSYTPQKMHYDRADRGSAEINVYYDLNHYRDSDISDAISNMVGAGKCDFENKDASSTCTDEEAKKVFWKTLAESYNDTIGQYVECNTDRSSDNYGYCDPSENHIFTTNMLAGNPSTAPKRDESSSISFKGDGTVIGNAVAWALAVAEDDSHGYSQATRYGNPNYDCSSFVSYAFRAAGVNVPISTTFNMRDNFLPYGFVAIPFSKADLQPGDILLNEAAHVELYVGDGHNVGAHVAEDGGIYGVSNGDQTDDHNADSFNGEISVTPYYYDSWGWVLRYVG